MSNVEFTNQKSQKSATLATFEREHDCINQDDTQLNSSNCSFRDHSRVKMNLH